ncbi:MAG: YkgJ family cysteine cluster protein [Cellvibrionaceae bacterium]|nr:YkgJ family cysteine cluster protein [Cellvibrionaceae bacterium]
MSTQSPCLSCGACCASFRVSFYWGELQGAGGVVPDLMTEQIPPHRACMKGTNQKDPRCAALLGNVGEQVRCTIYENRPSPAGTSVAMVKWRRTTRAAIRRAPVLGCRLSPRHRKIRLSTIIRRKSLPDGAVLRRFGFWLEGGALPWCADVGDICGVVSIIRRLGYRRRQRT